MNMIKVAIIMALAFPRPAPAQLAQAPEATPAAVAVPDEATKIRALKRAYEINGNSMVGDGRMIDVSKEIVTPADRSVDRNDRQAKPPTMPQAEAAPPTVVRAEAAPVSRPDVCKRHGLRKITTEDGRSWRCRK